MTKRSWDELRSDFEHVAFKSGIENVADAIPADRATVYRILNGSTQRPTRAVQQGIERVVEEHQEGRTDDQ